MSILLIGDPGSLGEVLVRRLVAEGDEVRAIATDANGDELSGHGVHIARGPYLDADLVERAAQNVRTIVSFDASEELLQPVVDGARAARVDRVVVCASAIPDAGKELLRASGLEYVILRSPRRGLFRKGPSEEAVAEAIDAADDMAGELRLELDLSDVDAWAILHVDPPEG